MTIATHEELMDAISELKENEAKFCLQALMIAGHVSGGIMERTVNLAKTLNWSDK